MIPDLQVRPGAPLDHLRWIGQYIVERQPDVIVQIGDWADMESLSSYDKGKLSFEGRRYKRDIEVVEESLDVLDAPIAEYNYRRRNRYEPRYLVTLGNHEDRISRAVDDQPELAGFMDVDDLPYAEHGWEVHDYLEPVWIDGVAYAHYFYRPNTGRSYSGMIETRLKNIGHSFTQGHEQTLSFGLHATAAGRRYGLVAGACYLHDEDYKGPQGNSEWRGIVVKHEVHNGEYDPMFVSLDFLCRRYENKPLEHFMKRSTR